jgi:hypothetical protein
MTAKETVDNIASRITDAVVSRVRRSLRSGAFVERTWGQVYGLSRRSDGLMEASVLLAGDAIDGEGLSYGFVVTNSILPKVGDTVEVERDEERGERRIIDIISQSAYHKLEIDLGNGYIAFGDGTTEPSLFLSLVSGQLQIGQAAIGAAATLSQFTANQNDLAGDATKSVWRVSSDISRDLTGIVARVGMFVDLINIGNYDIVLKHESPSSAAANRILVPNAVDLTLTPNKAARLWYDVLSARWRVLSSPGGTESYVVRSGSFTADAYLKKTISGSFTADAQIVAAGADYVNNVVLAMTPDAYWPMQEASGNLTDSSGNSWTATKVGSPTYQVSGPTINGQSFYGITLTNGNYFTVAATLTDPSTTGFTVSAWIKAPADAAYRYILRKNQTDEGVFYLRKTSGDVISIVTVNDANGTHGSANSPTAINDTWLWVAARYDTGGTPTLRVYAGTDTTDDTTFTGTWDRVGDPNTFIGATGTDYWDGEICHLAYWDTPLTDAQMTALRTGVPV